MVLPYEPQICKRSKKAVLRPAGQVCPSSALFFKFILAILRKKVKFLHAKCTYTGEILPEKFRFLVNLRVVCRILTAAGAFAIILSKSGTEPGVRAEARFLHPDGAFIQNACLRPLCAAPQRAESPGRFSGTALLLFTDATKGSAFGANTKGRPFFLGSPFGGAGASAPERARPLQTTHIRPLRHCCAMPPLPRGEARSNGIKGGSFHENQNQFHHPQHRAGGAVPGTGLRAAHGHRPCAAGGQHALPDAFPHSAVRLCAGRAVGPGRRLRGPAAALGAVRYAADVPHRHLHGL